MSRSPRVVRGFGTTWRVAHGRLLVLPPEGDPLVVGWPAPVLWEALANPVGTADCIDDLARRFTGHEDVASIELHRLLATLVEVGAVTEVA